MSMVRGEMGRDEEEAKLVDQVAEAHEVPASLLRELLALDEEFPNMNAHGARPRLQRRVSQVIDAALEPKD